MTSLSHRQTTSAALAATLTGVRRRWRLRHVAFGIALAVGVVAASVWVAALFMESLRFTPDSVSWARWGVGLATALVAARWIVFPLLRRVGDDRLALYVEERVPELDGALISAVEVQQRPADALSRSPRLVEGLLGDAVRRVRLSTRLEALERPATSKALAVAALLAVGLFTLVLTGPSYLRDGVRLLVTPWKDPARAPVYSIDVLPGDAVVPKGSDVQVSAALVGFSSELVEVAVRRGTSAEWERIPMGFGADSTRYVARLFDVTDNAEYYVESNGVRSDVGTLTVRNLPAVSGVDLELRYPAYTGLPVERIKDGGDIAALRGTRATIQVRTTQAVRGGRLVLGDSTIVPLVATSDTVLSATIVVRRDGFYRVDLDSDDGTRVAGSVEYVVDALEDGDPNIAVQKPGRDMRPSAVDEVFVEVLATDDFGIGKIELVYRVNGGAEQTIVLSDGTGRRLREMTAGHTLFLEEHSLQPGDIVSYYARAWDNDGVNGAKKAASDIYFLTIRPFSREYRQSQQGGGGGGGGGEQNPGELVQLQREVIAATYKADRDSAKTPAAKYRADVATIHLSQGRLREQLADLIARVRRPAVMASDTTFGKLAEILPKAEDEMKIAESQLVERRLKSALEPEQRALQWLERAEALYREVQVSMQQGGGGGGGGGSAAQAEDLADLLELENDKLRNQYEQAQRSTDQQQQNSTAQVDSTLEALKRLAARQQQENERARQRLSAANSSGSGGGGSQRQLADETEELARQLERLAREQNSQEMQTAARELQDAANSMRRSATNSPSTGRSPGGSAMDRLEAARRLMDDVRQERLTSGVQEAAQRAQQLADQQRGVAEGVEQLPRAGAGRPEQEQRLMQRKQEMASSVDGLQEDLERLAREQRREQGGAARQLQEAARSLREGRLADHMRYSAQRLRDASPSYANNYERNIQDVLDSLSARLSSISATARAGSDSSARNARALAQARDLVRAMTSIDERMRERQARGDSAAGAGRGLTNAQQRPDSLAQAGQEQGQRGQQGQQGQGQQGQGQQGQGQQGQGQGQQQGQGGGQGGGQAGEEQGQGGSRAQGGQGRRLGDDPPQGTPGQRTLGGRIGGGGQGLAFGGLSPEDGRQFSRELRSQRDAAEALRRDLAAGGISTADLERLIARMRELEAGRVFNDPEELERLRGSLVEGLKEFEFGLRRQLGVKEAGGPVLGGNDDVPQAYRDLVSEYFRSLSRKSKP